MVRYVVKFLDGRKEFGIAFSFSGLYLSSNLDLDLALRKEL